MGFNEQLRTQQWRASGAALVSKSIFRSRASVGDAKLWFCIVREGENAPPPQRSKNEGLRNADPVYAVLGVCVVGMGGLAPPWPRRKTMVLRRGLERGCPPSLEDQI